jgi:hypothetical protein
MVVFLSMHIIVESSRVEFIFESNRTRTLFSIEAFNGRTITNHSRFTVEDEILLLPGTYRRVISQFNPAPDMDIIHLKQIRPPHELVEPSFSGSVRTIHFTFDYTPRTKRTQKYK